MNAGRQGLLKNLVHILLFLLTFGTTTLAGVQWLNLNPLELNNLPTGVLYAILIMAMLGSHELGHYIAARKNRIDATLPYFLPFPSFLFLGMIPFGTLGAVIRLKEPVQSRKVLFDIGATGPLVGFVVSAIILATGFMTLPSIDYLYTIHPEYAGLDAIPEKGLRFGGTLFYLAFQHIFAPAGAFVPPMNEIYHYPFLCVGWFGMFVTAMNLLPVGQLDGGHIVYAMFGKGYHRIAQSTLVILVVLGTLGFLPALGIPFEYGWTGWLFWALLLIFFMRGVRMTRGPMHDDTAIGNARVTLGWLCLLIFVGSFSLAPFTLSLE